MLLVAVFVLVLVVAAVLLAPASDVVVHAIRGKTRQKRGKKSGGEKYWRRKLTTDTKGVQDFVCPPTN